MGVELNLLPLYINNSWLSHQIIAIGKEYDLFDKINKLPQSEIPEALSCYLARDKEGETHYGYIMEDPYGNKLKWVTVGDLLSLKDSDSVKDNWKVRAAWAYLAEMPSDWKIVLYWH